MSTRARWASMIALTIVTVGMFFGGATVAQEPPGNAGSGNDDHPQLHLSTKASEYHQGELIPVELSFTSKTPERYQVNIGSYDRSGRSARIRLMSSDNFLVEPKDGTEDALLVYFKSLQGLPIFGWDASYGLEPLSDSPTIIHLDLNEWIRFDSPGNYRISAVSRRVIESSKSQGMSQRVVLELKSNTIDLRIIEADSAWQEQQLQKILAELDLGASQPSFILSESRFAALRALRYLGSADAARELALHLRGDEYAVDSYCMLGLIGLRNRMTGLEEMRKLLIDPDFPVTERFLATMAILPLDPGDSPETLRQRRDTNLKALRLTLMNTVSMKKGKALAVSLDTALRGMDENTGPELRSKFIIQLIENFGELPIQNQINWLGQGWASVRDPKWLPLLRALAAQYTDLLHPERWEEEQSLKVTGGALTRWYELDPQGARDAVIAEIVRPKPRYSANTLGILPDKVLPNEQHAIATHFLVNNPERAEGNLASLLSRYADGTVLPEVLGKISQKIGHWACLSENNALAYVQKVDPEAAKPLFERQQKDSACGKFPMRPDLP